MGIRENKVRVLLREMASIEDVERLIEEEEEEFRRPVEHPEAFPQKKKRPTLGTLMTEDQRRTLRRTGLDCAQFKYILSLLTMTETQLKRGPKLPDVGLRLVIILQWLRFGHTYKELADAYSMSPGSIQTAISSLWDPLCKVLTETFLPKKPRDYRPTRSFKNFPNAIGALDATLIPTVQPANKVDNDAWFSGKHQHHGAKLQVISAPDGTVIHFGGVIPGRRNDKFLFDQSDVPRALSQTITNDDGLQIIVRPPILADGGYQGIHETYPEAIIPHRKPPHGRLTPEQKHENRLISQDRVVVEQFFGRLKNIGA